MENSIVLDFIMTREQNESIGLTVKNESRRLLDFIRRRVASDDDARDIMQDVLFQFVSTVRHGPVEKATSWLYRVAYNRIIDWYRKHKPESLEQVNRISDDSDEESVPFIDYLLSDNSNNPDVLYQRSLLWTMLNEALNELPEKQRSVFIMHELENKSFKEISEISGEGVNTLLSRKRYAVLYLRERLQDWEDILSEL